MSTRNRLFALRPALLLAAFLLPVFASPSHADAAGLRKGDRAVRITLSGIDGRRVSLGVGKRVVVVAFVRLGEGDKASENSDELLRELERFKKTLPQGAACEVAAVLSKGKAEARSLGLSFPVLVDSKHEVYGAYGVRVHPYTFVIGKDGNIVETVALSPASLPKRIKAAVWGQLGLKVAKEKHQEADDGRGKRQVNMARRLLLRGDTTGAMRYVEPFLGLQPTVEAAHILAGEIKLEEQDAAGAKQHFEKVLEENPKSWEALLGLARLDLLSGDLDGAQKGLEALLGRCPKPSRVHYSLGDLWKARGDDAKAAEHFKVAYEKLVDGK